MGSPTATVRCSLLPLAIVLLAMLRITIGKRVTQRSPFG